MSAGSQRVVIAALAVNLLIAIFKFIAAFLSRSTAMLAEAAHSLADCCNQVFLLIGAQPFTEWLPPEVARDDRGFILTGIDLPDGTFPLERRPFPLETSIPGVFAAGDIRHGSVKRVASAVGEGSIAVQMVHQYFADVGYEPHPRNAGAGSAAGWS